MNDKKITKYPPFNPKFGKMLHGGDYNPDQWMHMPGIWDEDMRLMKLSKCNAVSIGIFSWTALEKADGVYDFGWLDEIMDKLAENGVYAVLSTPSGARPAWMSNKYPEVLRVTPERRRNLHGGRHNHCYTSPIYREKTQAVNKKLAKRYKDHPALYMWHVSNEYGGECHCPLCQQAFREWLKDKYDNDLDKLNKLWWTSFWSHIYTDWSQIESPSPIGERGVHGLSLDWKRFVTYQTIDFYKSEIEPLRAITPDVPITVNMMGTYTGLDYWKFAPEVDAISWDNYPCWHGVAEDWRLAAQIAFKHDINRSLKGGKPFMLMESTPSMTNWQPVAKLKRPGMHLLSSLQAVAHGSDTVLYFQWRKSRGSSEKLHGAVVDHCGHENNRVFKDVTSVGDALDKLDAVVGTTVRGDVALIYDWENRWAIDMAQGPRIEKREYEETCVRHYTSLWKRNIPVDVINMDADFSSYKLLVAPMLYMTRPGVAERIEEFVSAGGTFVATYWSGIVNEYDLCNLGGFPGPLKNVLGIWDEEIDSLYENDSNSCEPVKGNELGLVSSYKSGILCALIHTEGAKVQAVYGSDFYKGRPCLTVNDFGDGKAWYIASRNSDEFLDDFYTSLDEKLDLYKAMEAELPTGVNAQIRTDGENEFIFLMNFNADAVTVDLKSEYDDILNGGKLSGSVEMTGYGVLVLQK